jgi:GT2 family glycosyltransferase
LFWLNPNEFSEHIDLSSEALEDLMVVTKTSADHLKNLARLYFIILGRAPDREGLEHYLVDLESGQELTDVASELLGSQEFQDRFDGRNEVEVLIENALDRAPTEEEFNTPKCTLACRLGQDNIVQARYPIFQTIYPSGAPPDDIVAYGVWLDEARIQRRLRSHPCTLPQAQPLLSIIVVVEHQRPALFQTALESILAQSDRRFEILIAHRGPLDKAIFNLLASKSRHHFIRTVRVLKWRSRTALLNKTLRLCKGAFVCLLDRHDHIDRETVAELAAVAPKSDIVISDEDTLDSAGTYKDPIFNTAWDPELALTSPPRGLLIVRTNLLKSLGGWRKLAAGVEDWDTLLRASLRLRESSIRHLPVVLRHRADVSSPKQGHDFAKTRLMLKNFLKASGRSDCILTGGDQTPFRVIYPLPAPAPLASIIIPTRDRADLLRNCVDGLLNRTDYPSFEIIIIDNASVEKETFKLFNDISKDGRVRILARNGAFNWSDLNNYAVSEMRGQIAILLNNDTDVIDPGWLRELVSQAIRPEIGLVGAKLLYPDNSIQHAGIVLGHDGYARHIWRHAKEDDPGYMGQLTKVRTVAAVTGACVAIRRNVFEEVGGLDQETLKITWNDIDLSLKVRALGYRIIWTPHAVLYHVELATRQPDDQAETRKRFEREHRHMRSVWGSKLCEDPYFSPNLAASDRSAQLVPYVRSARIW